MNTFRDQSLANRILKANCSSSNTMHLGKTKVPDPEMLQEKDDDDQLYAPKDDEDQEDQCETPLNDKRHRKKQVLRQNSPMTKLAILRSKQKNMGVQHSHDNQIIDKETRVQSSRQGQQQQRNKGVQQNEKETRVQFSRQGKQQEKNKGV
ncbi:hypothetical protein V2J09_006262 [Rumex salicifolius]